MAGVAMQDRPASLGVLKSGLLPSTYGFAVSFGIGFCRVALINDFAAAASVVANGPNGANHKNQTRCPKYPLHEVDIGFECANSTMAGAAVPVQEVSIC